jgi:hypothetical protein
MIRPESALVLVAASFLASAVIAQPTRPPDVLLSVPPPDKPQVQDRVSFVSQGPQPINLEYWDGEATWRLVELPPHRSVEIICRTCAGTITVAYHDGRQNRTVPVKGGGTYVLRWSAEEGAWKLTSRANP